MKATDEFVMDRMRAHFRKDNKMDEPGRSEVVVLADRMAEIAYDVGFKDAIAYRDLKAEVNR